MRNTMCYALILSLCAIAYPESKTEVVVQRGTVKTQTNQGERVVNAGQKSILTEGQKPLVAVNDPLVQDVIQMYRWAREEQLAGLHPVELVQIAVHALDEENLWRSSAISMLSGDVPSTFTPAPCSAVAILFGTWPPMDMMTPSGSSLRQISSTDSRESSSK